MKTAMKLAATTLLMAAMPLTANAQFARNSDAPIEATADDIVNVGGKTILTGQVDVRQGGTRILSDKMEIFGAAGAVVGNSATSDISRIEATGSFYYITPEQEVRGNNGIYTQSTDTFTVTGDVILLQGENVVTGDKLIYNLKTEEARVVGTCKGRRCGSKGRVKILLKNAGGSQS